MDIILMYRFSVADETYRSNLGHLYVNMYAISILLQKWPAYNGKAFKCEWFH